MVTLFSSLSLVNVRLLNDGLFVVLFSSDAIVEAFPLHYIWYSVSLLSLASFFFPLLYWRTWVFLFLRDSLVLLFFFFSYFESLLTIVRRFTKFVFDFSCKEGHSDDLAERIVIYLELYSRTPDGNKQLKHVLLQSIIQLVEVKRQSLLSSFREFQPTLTI